MRIISSNYDNFKELIRHGLVYGLTGISTTAIGFLLLPLYTRFISTHNYGVYALLVMTTSIISIIFSLGISAAIFRFYYDNNDENYRNSIISNSFIILLGSFLCMILIGLVISPYLSEWLFNSKKYSYMFNILFINTGLNFIIGLSYSIYRAKRMSTTYAKINILNFILSITFILIFLLVFKLDILAIILGTTISSIIIFLITIINIYKYIKLSLDFILIRKLIYFSFPIIFVDISLFLLTWFDRYLLNIYSSLSDVGLYNFGYQIGSVLMIVLITPFRLIWGSMKLEISHHSNSRIFYSQILKYFTCLALFIFIMLSLISIDGIKLFAGKEFWSSYQVIPLIIFGLVFYGMSISIDIGILIKKKTKYYALIYFSALLINILTNLFFIPKYGMIGAAFTTMLSYIYIFLIYMFINYKLYPINYKIKTIITLFIISIIIFFIGWFIPLENFINFDNEYFNYVIFTIIRIIIAIFYIPIIIIAGIFNKNEINELRKLISEILMKIKNIKNNKM